MVAHMIRRLFVLPCSLAVLIASCCPPGSGPGIVADAGEDQTVQTREAVTIGANDPEDADVARFVWTQVSGAAVVLSDENAARPTFNAPASSGVLRFRLTVIDYGSAGCFGLTSEFVTVTVTDRPCTSAGEICDDDEFCLFATGQCDNPGASGVCTERPQVCTEEFAPVCGCDDVTYSNACNAFAAGTSVLTVGPCGPG